jgi:MFS transporter, putative metabolite:H+ symporter
VFSLGAMCFVIAALAVAVLGIETRGLALETLVSEAEEVEGSVRVGAGVTR